jgi:stage IV sporulation protein FB
MFRFRIFGVPVEVQPMFWIVFFIFGGALRGENWNVPGMLNIALFIMAGFISLMVHELGHALTGKAFGAPTQITLHGFGGYAAFPAGSFTRKQNFVVTFAGPAVQILLGLIMLALALSVNMPSDAIGYFVSVLAGISLYWAVLNLLPVVPLDGGNMLMSALGPNRIRVTLWISFVTAITAGCAMLIYTRSILFPLFLASFAFENWKVIQHLKGR